MTTKQELKQRKCTPCEGGVAPLSRQDAETLLGQLSGWEITADGQRIAKRWTLKDFLSGIRFFDRVAEVAEREGHHPDLHLESYRQARIEIWTHAIGGLSENDFILAAKIDELPVERKS